MLHLVLDCVDRYMYIYTLCLYILYNTLLDLRFFYIYMYVYTIAFDIVTTRKSIYRIPPALHSHRHYPLLH